MDRNRPCVPASSMSCHPYSVYLWVAGRPAGRIRAWWVAAPCLFQPVCPTAFGSTGTAEVSCFFSPHCTLVTLLERTRHSLVSTLSVLVQHSAAFALCLAHCLSVHSAHAVLGMHLVPALLSPFEPATAPGSFWGLCWLVQDPTSQHMLPL